MGTLAGLLLALRAWLGLRREKLQEFTYEDQGDDNHRPLLLWDGRCQSKPTVSYDRGTCFQKQNG